VRDDNPTALTVQDEGSTPVKYFVVNSKSERLETHTPLHILDTRIEAVDNNAAGLSITAEEGNPLLTFDTTDGFENVKAIKPLNAVDATDSCGTGTVGTCSNFASLVTTGGLTVGMKTFMTGASSFSSLSLVFRLYSHSHSFSVSFIFPLVPLPIFCLVLFCCRVAAQADEGQ
jgi:hypothetical protein